MYAKLCICKCIKRGMEILFRCVYQNHNESTRHIIIQSRKGRKQKNFLAKSKKNIWINRSGNQWNRIHFWHHCNDFIGLCMCVILPEYWTLLVSNLVIYLVAHQCGDIPSVWQLGNDCQIYNGKSRNSLIWRSSLPNVLDNI